MSKTIDKIRGLLNLPNLTKFYAEARLDDGRLVVTEAESMAVGVEISVMSDEGNADFLDDGTYALEDGTVLVVAEGRITQLGEDATRRTLTEFFEPYNQQLYRLIDEDFGWNHETSLT